MSVIATAQPPVLEVSDVWTRYDRDEVHRGVNLSIAPGQVVALIGSSGSGKTTLLREAVGLESPWRGEIRLFGEPLARVDRHSRRDLLQRVGVMFQHGALFSSFTVFDNIAFPLRELKRFDEAAIRTLVSIKLDMVGLEPRHAWLLPAELSGGMVKRVALARALALEPEFLVLDEPTAGLDPGRAASFVRLIKMLQDELHLTVFMVTHDLDTLTSLATRVAALAEQRVIAEGTLAEVMAHPHPFLQGFFNASAHEVN
jgi:phospholipid/cholesterol/gamma-HCH transport system ATP-binding protein